MGMVGSVFWTYTRNMNNVSIPYRPELWPVPAFYRRTVRVPTNTGAIETRLLYSYLADPSIRLTTISRGFG